MKYAAYDDHSVYGIGANEHEAIADARRGAKDDDAQFKTAMISDALHTWIKQHGWCGHHESFDVVAGQLFRLTDHQFFIGDKVEGGTGEDHDVGKVVGYLDPPKGKCDVLVAWQSGVTTEAVSADLEAAI